MTEVSSSRRRGKDWPPEPLGCEPHRDPWCVQAQPQAAGSVGSAAPLMLGEGQAAIVTGQQIKLDPAGAQPQKFVRQLGGGPALDPVDLIAGGDGTTQRRGIAIARGPGLRLNSDHGWRHADDLSGHHDFFHLPEIFHRRS